MQYTMNENSDRSEDGNGTQWRMTQPTLRYFINLTSLQLLKQDPSCGSATDSPPIAPILYSIKENMRRVDTFPLSQMPKPEPLNSIFKTAGCRLYLSAQILEVSNYFKKLDHLHRSIIPSYGSPACHWGRPRTPWHLPGTWRPARGWR